MLMSEDSRHISETDRPTMSDEMSNLLEKPLFAPKTIITMPSAIPKPRTLYDRIWDDHVV